jgi:phage host-nuclease inhibitor protein Gam
LYQLLAECISQKKIDSYYHRQKIVQAVNAQMEYDKAKCLDTLIIYHSNLGSEKIENMTQRPLVRNVSRPPHPPPRPQPPSAQQLLAQSKQDIAVLTNKLSELQIKLNVTNSANKSLDEKVNELQKINNEYNATIKLRDTKIAEQELLIVKYKQDTTEFAAKVVDLDNTIKTLESKMKKDVEDAITLCQDKYDKHINSKDDIIKELQASIQKIKEQYKGELINMENICKTESSMLRIANFELEKIIKKQNTPSVSLSLEHPDEMYKTSSTVSLSPQQPDVMYNPYISGVVSLSSQQPDAIYKQNMPGVISLNQQDAMYKQNMPGVISLNQQDAMYKQNMSGVISLNQQDAMYKQNMPGVISLQ